MHNVVSSRPLDGAPDTESPSLSPTDRAFGPLDTVPQLYIIGGLSLSNLGPPPRRNGREGVGAGWFRQGNRILTAMFLSSPYKAGIRPESDNFRHLRDRFKR